MAAQKAEKSVTLRLPSSLHEQLKEIAEEEDRTMSQVMRVAARQYLQGRETQHA